MFQISGLLLFATLQCVQADQAPRIDLPPSYTVEILSPQVIEKASSVTVFGSLRRSTPWAGTDWGFLEIALFDEHGRLIKRVAADYSPKPIPESFHSPYQPRAHFSASINGVNRPVTSVLIRYHDGSSSLLKTATR
jgi:hypothetical protein